MDKLKDKVFELETLCPLLAIIHAERNNREFRAYQKALLRMKKAHKLNGHDTYRMTALDASVEYLKSLQEMR